MEKATTTSGLQWPPKCSISSTLITLSKQRSCVEEKLLTILFVIFLHNWNTWIFAFLISCYILSQHRTNEAIGTSFHQPQVGMGLTGLVSLFPCNRYAAKALVWFYEHIKPWHSTAVTFFLYTILVNDYSNLLKKLKGKFKIPQFNRPKEPIFETSRQGSCSSIIPVLWGGAPCMVIAPGHMFHEF